MRAPVTAVRSGVHRFGTPTPETDGTLCWGATTAVTVEVDAGGCTGLGWTYSARAAASVVALLPGQGLGCGHAPASSPPLRAR